MSSQNLNQDLEEQLFLFNENPGNLLTSIFKSYCVTSSVIANIDIKQKFTSNKQVSEDQIQEEQEITDKENLKECLILCKPTSLEIFVIKEGVSEPLFEQSLYANLKAIQKIPSQNPTQPDLLFVLTEDLRYCFAHISKYGSQIKQEGDLYFKNKAQVYENQIIVNNYYQQDGKEPGSIKGCLYVFAYERELIVFRYKVKNGEFDIKKPVFLRIHESDIYDIAQLKIQSNNNLLAVVYNDQQFENSTFKVFDFDEKESEELSIASKRGQGWFFKTEEYITAFIPLTSIEGIILFTQSGVSVYTYGSSEPLQTLRFEGIVNCYVSAKNNNTRGEMYVIGVESIVPGKSGELYLLNFEQIDETISKGKSTLTKDDIRIELKFLGECSSPKTLQYLQNKFIFLGSDEDDGQLLKITDEVNHNTPNSPYLKIWALFGNLGKIFSLKSIQKDSNQQLLLSTPNRAKSLNTFQKSVSLNKLRNFSFSQPIKQIFVVCDNIILISFRTSSLLLQIEGHYFQEFDKSKYVSSERTIYFCQIQDNIVAQVTQKKIYIIDLTKGIVNKYEKETNLVIYKCLHQKQTLFCVCNNNLIKFYDINLQDFSVTETKKIQLSQSISAIAVHGHIIAISQWFDPFVRLVNIHNTEDYQDIETNQDEEGSQEVIETCTTLQPQIKTTYDGKENIHSLIFHDQGKLLVGYGDGNIRIIYMKNADNTCLNFQIEQIKELNLGFKPVEFKTFTHLVSYFVGGDTKAINCVSSEATILKYLEEKNERFEKIQINIHNIQKMEEILINQIPHILSVVDNNTIQIGSLETSQKFHISSFGKNEKYVGSTSLVYIKEQEKQDMEVEEECKKGEEKEQDIENIKNQGNQENYVYKNEIVCVHQNKKFIIGAFIYEDSQSEVVNSKIIINDFVSQEILDQVDMGSQRVYSVTTVQNMVLVGGENIQNIDKDGEFYDQGEFDKGSIHVINITEEGKVSTYDKINLPAQVIDIKKFREKYIVVLSGQVVIFYEIIQKKDEQESQALKELFKYQSEIVIDSVDIKDNGFLLIADPSKNIVVFKILIGQKTLLPYCKNNPFENSIEANFYGNAILQSDIEGNVLIYEKDLNVQSDLERIEMKVTDAVYLGEQIISMDKQRVNTFELNDKLLKKQELEQIIYGTCKGSIGSITNLPDNIYKILKELQNIILQEYEPELGFTYKDWRQVRNLELTENNFISFDVIKKIQDYKNTKVQQIIDQMNLNIKPTVNDLILLVDNLERLTF